MASKVNLILSGGQTGVDRAAFDVAAKLGILRAGWCPSGRKAENGLIPACYPLSETASDLYEERTELNARDSDGTLIIIKENAEGGTSYTIQMAEKHAKPYLIVSFLAPPEPEVFEYWILTNKIRVLNIAGHRESHSPGEIYKRSVEVLSELLKRVI